ncbi:hypothetical protein QFZ53_003229 [Microbacterium natoriense]|uniref:HNH nuclease domain-containing protein n=1 Tax=Microbacterium natoriense TaxID=284570 RepID=A0AAW8EZV3_9MICO|nr:HNH endonuclease signature motif containing protein [Microbacterium natoriense]MDQ0649033.1 hypothetical protein [Microbacterium natoriense]
MIDATDSQMATLADLVESLAAADATVNAMMAARDGLLALAGRMAVDIAKQGDHSDGGDMTMRTVAAEIGQRLRVSDRTVERRIAEASCLVDGFPTVWAAQGAGRIAAAHAHVIIETGAQLIDAVQRDAYAAAVLPLAEVESPNRLRPLARRIVERFQELPVDDRHRQARSQRRVWARDQDDAMADLTLHGPAVLVHAMMDRLSQMAHEIRSENLRAAKEARVIDGDFTPDARSVDEIRADLLADLVLTGSPAGHDIADGLLGEIRGRIEITVPVMTLMGQDLGANAGHRDSPPSSKRSETKRATAGTPDIDARSLSEERSDETKRPTIDGLPPAILDGAVPIDARTARLLAGTTPGWDRVLTHPVSGAVLAADRYRPPEQLKRHLRARDQRCRFPTCGLAARKCDLDHNDAASTGGSTSEGNLSAFCRRHHTLKHASPWHVRHRSGGLLEWTSPTGRTYLDTPPPPNTVVFTSETSEPCDSVEIFVDRVRAPF